jgi:hypothetical protein
LSCLADGHTAGSPGGFEDPPRMDVKGLDLSRLCVALLVFTE